MIRSSSGRLRTFVPSVKPSRFLRRTTVGDFGSSIPPPSASSSHFITSSPGYSFSSARTIANFTPSSSSHRLLSSKTLANFTTSSTLNMSSASPTNSEIAEAFNPSVLSSLRDFWFHGLSESELILPPMSAAMRWFQRSEEFDKACYSNFSLQISLLKSSDLTIPSLIDALSENYSDTSPISPLDWLSLILLLDQIPRNIFRDADAKIVFTVTDPKALELAHYVIKNKIPEQIPVAYRLAYRFWFYLPLEHSEDPHVQEESVAGHEKMFADLKGLGAKSEEEVGGLDPDTRACYDVINGRKDDLGTWESALMEKYVLGHKRIIDRFGRFPHRNEVLGRESTDDEGRYLREGGDTFGG